jgi:predicted HicB family RNase H-like nuclease
MKRGRPKKPAGERKEIILCHRITKAEHRKLLTAAKRAGLSLSDYAKKKLLGD